MKKKKNILFIVSLIVLILAIGGMVTYFAIRAKQAKEYEDIAAIARSTTETATTEVTTPTTTAATETTTEETTPEETTKPKPDIPIDFESLQEINPDIYAWLSIPGTSIDYPILHSSEDDPDYYLDHTVYHDVGLPGAIYTQSNHNKDLGTDNLTVIYGHRMLDKTMFGPFEKFWDEEFRQDHNLIIIYTPEHIYTYLLCFALTFDDRNLMYTYDNCTDPANYEMFRNDIMNERQLPSWIHYEFPDITDQRMVVLSTCNGIDVQRILVGGVLIDEQ